MSSDVGKSGPGATRSSEGNGRLATGREVHITVRPRPAWFDVQFVDDDGNGIPNIGFRAMFADSTSSTFVTDAQGYFQSDDVPEGEVRIQSVDGEIIEAWGDDGAFDPAYEDGDTAQADFVEYVIRSGDTLSKIGIRFGLDWRRLYHTAGPDGVVNSDRLRSGNPDLIFPGEVLWVPVRRRLVRLHTNSAPSSISRIRVRARQRPRTAEQQRSALIRDVYERRLKHICVDNLAVAVGWSDDSNELEVKALCREITAELRADTEHYASNWYLLLVQGDSMRHYDSKGDPVGVYRLRHSPEGPIGAYAVFAMDPGTFRPYRAIFNPSVWLDQGSDDQMELYEAIKDEDQASFRVLEESKQSVHGEVALERRDHHIDVLFQAPVSRAHWEHCVLSAGRGVLDDYLESEKLNRVRHGRNLKVLEHYATVYRRLLGDYRRKLDRINVEDEDAEEAIQELGRPPEPYRFPLPSGCSVQRRSDLLDRMGGINSLDAWREIARKLHNVRNHRWGTSRRPDGSVFFRTKLTLKPGKKQQFDFQVRDVPGYLKASCEAKLEWDFTFGTGGGFKQAEKRSVVCMVEAGVGRTISAGTSAGTSFEVEIDEKGGVDLTFKLRASKGGQEVVFSTSTSGESKVVAGTKGVKATSSWNQKTREGGYGVAFEPPRPPVAPAHYVGQPTVYVGLHFQGMTDDALLAFLTRAPGFFERKTVRTLIKTAWKDLDFQEAAKLHRLGWTPETWDTKHILDLEELPISARTPFDRLPPSDQRDARHLGFVHQDAVNWTRWWTRKRLVPIEDASTFTTVFGDTFALDY